MTLVKDEKAVAMGADAAKGFYTGGGVGSTWNAARASRNLPPRSQRAAGGTVTQRRHQVAHLTGRVQKAGWGWVRHHLGRWRTRMLSRLRVGVLVPATTGFYEDGQTGQEVQ